MTQLNRAKLIGQCCAVVILALASHSALAGKIIKWTDSNGVVHYGDKLPPEQMGKSNMELNSGVVTKRNKPAEVKSVEETQVDAQKLEQDRQDKVLLASYTKPEEIDAARDRGLQLDQAALESLKQQKETLNTKGARNEKSAAFFRAKKQPLPPNLQKDINLHNTELANIDKQMAVRKLSMEETRKKFDANKARFIELKKAVPAIPAAF